MLIRTQSLGKNYGAIRALQDCTFGVQAGEVVGLLGPNGAGKTTLLRLLLGFLRPTAGWARIDDLDCYGQSLLVRRRVAYLPGEVRLFRRMRGRDVLDFLVGLRGGDGRRRARESAGRVDLDLSRRVSRMSTGMRQKLALAATLAADVPLLVLDEPTNNLDPTVRGVVLSLVAEARAAGRTVLLSSHVLDEVERSCDRVIILREGRIVHTQTMSQLRRARRIRVSLEGDLPAPPESLREKLSVKTSGGEVVIESAEEIAPLLGWLATLPLHDVRIEPVGLRSVYQRYHGGATDAGLEDGRRRVDGLQR